MLYYVAPCRGGIQRTRVAGRRALGECVQSGRETCYASSDSCFVVLKHIFVMFFLLLLTTRDISHTKSFASGSHAEASRRKATATASRRRERGRPESKSSSLRTGGLTARRVTRRQERATIRSKQRDPDPKDNSIVIIRRHLYTRDSIPHLQHCFLIKGFLLGLGPHCLLLTRDMVLRPRPANAASCEGRHVPARPARQLASP